MNQIRKPMAFKIEAQPAKTPKATEVAPRKPQAASSIELVESDDVFNQEIAILTAEPTKPIKRKWTAWTIFLSATGLLLSLAAGLWVDTLMRNLFSRSDWLGYTAVSILALAIVALLIVIARELSGLAQLDAASLLRDQASDAAAMEARHGSSPMGIVERTLNSLPAESTTAVPRSLMQ